MLVYQALIKHHLCARHRQGKAQPLEIKELWGAAAPRNTPLKAAGSTESHGNRGGASSKAQAAAGGLPASELVSAEGRSGDRERGQLLNTW